MSTPAAAAALAAAALLAGCVAPVPYNQRVAKGPIYQQLDAQLGGGEIDGEQMKLEQLQNLVKLTLANATLFPEGGAELDDSGKAILAKLAPALKGLNGQRIVVKSFSDSAVTGVNRPVVPNKVELTKSRAAAIAAFLSTQGVSAEVIYTSGLGESHPVASNEVPQGRAQNRRVEIDVVEAPA